MCELMKKTNWIIMIIRIVLILACVGSLTRGIQMGIVNHELEANYFITAFTAIVSVAITYIPNFIRHTKFIAMPMILQTVFTVFTFLAMFFGEILRFYDRFNWWDSMLHFSSGIIFGLVGYMLFISLNRDSSVRGKLHPACVILFAVCFSIACGTVWEIFEFAGDSLLGMNMQRWQAEISSQDWAVMQNVSNSSNPGLVDTMKDIICDAAGTLLSIPILLPMVRRNNHYAKTNITTEELIAEFLPQKPVSGTPVPAPAICEQGPETELSPQKPVSGAHVPVPAAYEHISQKTA